MFTSIFTKKIGILCLPLYQFPADHERAGVTVQCTVILTRLAYSQNNPFVRRTLLLISDLISNKRILFVNDDLWSLVSLETVSSSIFHFPLLSVSLPNGSPLPVGRSNLVPSSISSPILTDIEQIPQLHLRPFLHNIGCGCIVICYFTCQCSFSPQFLPYKIF